MSASLFAGQPAMLCQAGCEVNEDNDKWVQERGPDLRPDQARTGAIGHRAIRHQWHGTYQEPWNVAQGEGGFLGRFAVAGVFELN